MRQLLLIASVLFYTTAHSQLIVGANAGVGFSFNRLVEDKDPRNYLQPLVPRDFTTNVYMGYAVTSRLNIYAGARLSEHRTAVELDNGTPHNEHEGGWLFSKSFGRQYSLKVSGELTLLEAGRFKLLASVIQGAYYNYASMNPDYLFYGSQYHDERQYLRPGYGSAPRPIIQVNGWESRYNNRLIYLFGVGTGVKYTMRDRHSLTFRADYTRGHTWNYQHKVFYQSDKPDSYSGAYKVYRNSSQLLSLTLGYEYLIDFSKK